MDILKSQVTISNVLSLIVVLVSVGGFWVSTEARQTTLELSVKVLKDSDIRHENEIREMRNDTKQLLSEIKSDIKDLRVAISAKK